MPGLSRSVWLAQHNAAYCHSVCCSWSTQCCSVALAEFALLPLEISERQPNEIKSTAIDRRDEEIKIIIGMS